MSKVYRIVTFLLMLVGIVVVWPEFWSAITGIFSCLSAYKWFFIGMGVCFLLRIIPFFREIGGTLETLSHELTHMVVGILFFKRVKSLKVNSDGSGEVWHSGKNAFGNTCISLAPYTLPLFTYILLLISLMIADKSMYLFHIFIGFTFAFHLICFALQTRLKQTDIKKCGYLRSFVFIALFLMFNIAVVLFSIKMGFADGIMSVCKGMWENLVAILKAVF